MRENPYQGVNAHLNSILQTLGTEDQPSLWASFHGQFIGYITDALNAVLPDQYIAFNEQSIQTRELDIIDLSEKSPKPRPDISVFKFGSSEAGRSAAQVLTPSWEILLAPVIEDVNLPRAAVIREMLPQQNIGRVVTRIEVLSPSNKPRKSGALAYHDRRQETLENGVPLVEIDLLHETLPIISNIPRYPDNDEAFPYSTVVSDPRPNWENARARGYGFRVDEVFKPFPVPLLNDEAIGFELTAVYQQLFTAGRWGYVVDYSLLPERFETYSSADQERIRAVMAHVAEKG